MRPGRSDQPLPAVDVDGLAGHEVVLQQIEIGWRNIGGRRDPSRGNASAHLFEIAAWLASAGVEGVDPNSGLTFDSATFAVESAVPGEGVVLGRSMLVSADLATGSLVRPFDHALKAVSSFYLVYPPEAIRQRKVKAFRDWPFSGIAPG
ncbi:LysR substrate-binding domain-containing protein [Mesorhizobium sp. M1D.F.Ca.ET.234.01.1.1]|uniref:LysR substrate-binding domain-containing protein n=1 Tax=unclassified Mesorhizobium TaxID=325217 RepID=UPI0026999B71